MWEQIRANKRKSVFLVIFMAAFLFVTGFALGEFLKPGGGVAGLAIAFVIWIILTLISYFQGDTIFLAMSGARKIKREDHPVLFNVVEEMRIASGLPKMPDIYIVDDAAPNAFATGRNPEKSAVAVTAGLLEMLDRNELQGVIAHELSHINNRDVLYMMLVGVMMGTIVLLADIGIRSFFWGGGRRRTSSSEGGGQAQIIMLVVALVLIILAPIIAQMIYFALSRKREYLADACAAQYTRYPEGLANALTRISNTGFKLKTATRATAPMYIINPLKINKKKLSDLSSTHPPTSERIKILRGMTGDAGFANYDNAFKKVTGRPVGIIPFTSLKSAKEISVEKPARKETGSPLDRLRDTTDLLWKLNKYIFIPCACGTNLKIPPAYTGKKIECPHCFTVHEVKQ